MAKLFVYGTLREGGCNHHFLKKEQLQSRNATIEGVLVDTGYGYPGLLLEAGEVVGELYQISEAALKLIDSLEGYFGPGHPDNLYERVSVNVKTSLGSGPIPALTYVYKSSDFKPERFTDWLAYAGSKQIRP